MLKPLKLITNDLPVIAETTMSNPACISNILQALGEFVQSEFYDPY